MTHKVVTTQPSIVEAIEKHGAWQVNGFTFARADDGRFISEPLNVDDALVFVGLEGYTVYDETDAPVLSAGEATDEHPEGEQAEGETTQAEQTEGEDEQAPRRRGRPPSKPA